MLGYWNEPEKTAEAIDKARWMHIGDLATPDQPTPSTCAVQTPITADFYNTICTSRADWTLNRSFAFAGKAEVHPRNGRNTL